jgi:hypothetical protein
MMRTASGRRDAIASVHGVDHEGSDATHRLWQIAQCGIANEMMV